MVKRVLGCLLLLALSSGSLAAFRASVDRRVVDEDDIVVLELQRDGQFSGTPDLSSLQNDFHILGTQRSSQFELTIGAGSMRAFTTWIINLQPQRRGVLQIPVIEYDGARTKPITITVTQASPEERAMVERKVFFETVLSKARLRVQEQVLYIVRLYYAADTNLYGDLSIQPQVSHAVVQSLGDSQPTIKVRDGMRYNVITQRYAIIPQRSGKLVIHPETFTGAIRFASDGRSRRRNIRITSDGHKVTVMPQPESWPAGTPWLPAHDLKLVERWEPSPPNLSVGEPVTRTIEMMALGLAASALPALPALKLAGIGTYASQPTLEEKIAANDFLASRIESTVIIPEQSGILELPEIRVPWFDVERDQVQVAVIPARRLTVTAGEGKTATNTQEANATNSNAISEAGGEASREETTDPFRPLLNFVPKQVRDLLLSWQALAGIFLLMVLVAWWSGRRSATRRWRADSNLPGLRELEAELRAACRANDPLRTRNAVTAWRRQKTLAPEQAAELENLLAELDRTLYSGAQTTWEGFALADFVTRVRKTARIRGRTPGKVALPPLHPALSSSAEGAAQRG